VVETGERERERERENEKETEGGLVPAPTTVWGNVAGMATGAQTAGARRE